MVRTALVPTIISIRLLGPRLMAAKFRGVQRDLTVHLGHAPHSRAPSEDSEAFYTSFSEALSEGNEMDTKVVLIDANKGPGEWRTGREHIVGPHGIPYAEKDVDNDPNYWWFHAFCHNRDMCVGSTWFQHKVSQKLTFDADGIRNEVRASYPRDSREW